MTTFSAQVDAWVRKSEARLEAVVKDAAQQVAIEVKSRTPVRTGFLRASLTASTSMMPIIDRNARPAEGALYTDRETEIALVIAGASLGEPIFLGFVANYAAHVEYGARGRAGVAMVRLTAQRWPQIVAESVNRIRSRVP